MEVDIHILKATGRLKPFVEEIEQLSHNAINRVREILPVKDVDIILYDNPEGVIPHIAIGGYTPNAHLVYISLDPEAIDFRDNLNKHAERQIAHELHHTVRWQNPGYGQTLLEALISEGLADVFSYEVFPGEIEEWDKALMEKELQKLKSLAKKHYFDNEYNHFEWFYGSDHIPKWTGYTLGFEMVTEFIMKHKKNASVLYAANAKEFI